jgi:predicted site-specific integrase-resolvase
MLTNTRSLTKTEVAELLGVCRLSVHRWVNGGLLRTDERGRIPRAEIERVLGNEQPRHHTEQFIAA